MITGVTINFTNTTTGQASSNDGVALIVAAFAAEQTSTLTIGQLYKLTSVQDLITAGWPSTADGGTAKSNLYQQVADFYSVAPQGTILYVYPILQSNLATFIPDTTSKGFGALLRSTGVDSLGNPNPTDRAKMVGILFPELEASPSEPYAEGVVTTAEAVDEVLTTLFDAGCRCCAVVDGAQCDYTEAPDWNTYDMSRTAIMDCTIHEGVNNGDVGLVLGYLCANPVNFDLGNVMEAQISSSGAYFTNGTSVATLAPADFDTLGQKQHLFYRTRDTKAGFFFNDSPTCAPSTQALSTLPANRVLIKVADYLQTFLTNYLGQTPPLDDDGNVTAGYLSAMEEQFMSTYITPMITDGEISNASITISNDSPFSSTRTLVANVQILQRPGIAQIEANITFVTAIQ